MRPTLRHPATSAASPVWAIAAGLLVLMPNFSASPFADDYDSQRLLELVACALGTGAVVLTPAARTAWTSTWARVPAWATALTAALGTLGLASGALAPRPVYAFAEVASFALMGVGIVGLASLGRGAARGGLALVAMLVLGGYAASVIPFHLLDLVQHEAETWPRRHLGFGNMRQVNHMHVWLLPLVWALAATSSTPWKRAGIRTVAAVTIAMMIATNGRGVLVALPVGLAVAVLTVRTERRTMLREVVVSATLGVTIWGVLFAGEPTALDKAEVGLNGRGELWAGALRMIGEGPWLGVGPMHFVYTPSPGGAHPHNLVLQLAAEWGLPAALCAVALALGAGVCWLRHVRRASASATPADGPWLAGLTAAFAGALVYALVDGFLIAPVSQTIAVLVLGALLAEALPSGHVEQARGAPWHGLVLAGVALPALAVLLAVVASDGPTLGRRDYDFRFAQVSAYSLPRFWSTGQIAARLPPEQARRWPEAPAPR